MNRLPLPIGARLPVTKAVARNTVLLTNGRAYYTCPARPITENRPADIRKGRWHKHDRILANSIGRLDPAS